MCGIVGVVRTTPLSEAERDTVRSMADQIVHRGPDDQGFFDGEHVCLGMRRLSIIDLLGGHQPIANEDKTIWVACNGEIYNFAQLRASLEQSGHQFSTASDVEVIVHLYEEYGVEFIDHLDGMFAIALWDERERRLYLVRDRLGIKPLYYFSDGTNISWASEIKALLKVRGINAELDPLGLRDHLAVGYSVAPRTIFAGIKKLSPGSMLMWDLDQYSVRRYWTVPNRIDDQPTEEEWVDRVLDSLGQAVASHMVSDVPIGAFLSGGIDSSAVVALMAQQSDRPVNTYSVGYVGDSTARYFNELPWARKVANRFGTEHREIQVRPDVAMLLPKLIWHLEEPISDSAITTTYLVAQLASDTVKVILSGVGGDELFAGYNRYLGDHYGSLYGNVPRWLRSSVIRPVAERLPSARHNRWTDLARYARSFVTAAELGWREQYKFYVALQEHRVLESLLGGNEIGGSDGFDRVLLSENSEDPLLRLFRIDAETQLSEDLLLLTDKMTMAESIECRVPFLDHHLVELAAQIPHSIKRPRGRLKSLLKKSLQPLCQMRFSIAKREVSGHRLARGSKAS